MTDDAYYRELESQLDAEFPAERDALDISVLRFQLANRDKQLREALAEVKRLTGELAAVRQTEVPLSANVGFANVGDDEADSQLYIWGPFSTADEARDAALVAETTVALIPVTAWDRT